MAKCWEHVNAITALLKENHEEIIKETFVPINMARLLENIFFAITALLLGKHEGYAWIKLDSERMAIT